MSSNKNFYTQENHNKTFTFNEKIYTSTKIKDLEELGPYGNITMDFVSHEK